MSQQPQPYAPAPYELDPQPQRDHNGWLIAVGLVLALALGGLAAAIIAKGDSGGATAPSVPAKSAPPSTIVQQSTTTVTTPAPTVTVAPHVTLAPDGTPSPDESSGQTTTAQTTTTSP